MPINLLLVDDDDVDIMAVKRAIESLKLTNPIVTAHNGLEALDILRGENNREKLPRPYIIILDLNMPAMDGIEFLRVLRADKELRDSIVFVLTTSDADEDRSAAYDMNVAGYVVKTDTAKSFMDALRMLNYYWTIVELP